MPEEYQKNAGEILALDENQYLSGVGEDWQIHITCHNLELEIKDDQ